jgi:hypothetical protein
VGIRNRLTKLEEHAASQDPCPACGQGGSSPTAGEVVIQWPQLGDPPGSETTQYCEVCGQPTTVVVGWGPLHQEPHLG